MLGRNPWIDPRLSSLIPPILNPLANLWLYLYHLSGVLPLYAMSPALTPEALWQPAKLSPVCPSSLWDCLACYSVPLLCHDSQTTGKLLLYDPCLTSTVFLFKNVLPLYFQMVNLFTSFTSSPQCQGGRPQPL